MSQQQSQLADGDTVTDFSQFHAGLTARLDELQNAVDKTDNYSMDVKYTSLHDGADRVSVVIENDKLFSSRYFFLIHQRGGLHVAERDPGPFGEKRDFLADYDTVARAWRLVCRSIERQQ
jgi:hypothetical protein